MAKLVEQTSSVSPPRKLRKRAYAYKRVADSLAREISEGRYAVGDQLPVEKALEDRFNVSRIVVRQAMGLLEQEQIIRREPGRGTFVMSRGPTNEAAPERHSLIGIVSDFKFGHSDAYGGPILRELAKQFSGTSRTPALFNIWCEGEDPNFEDSTLERLREVDGIVVLMPTLPIRTERILQQLIRLQKPVVGINFTSSIIDTIAPDNFNGGIQAAEHLLELGHRRMVCIEMENPSQGWKDRIEGFRHVLSRMTDASMRTVTVTPFNIHQRVCEFVDSADHLPTAIFAGTDENAVKVITALGKYDIKVPEDISVMGYNDEQVAESHIAPLSTIHVPLREMATHAARLLEQRIASGVSGVSHREILFATHLVVRESTAAPS
ncbi:GntR family transcriptional regulator [Phycisphaerales bacterium AB-hyl4]|uniref:GntR family transcriptional regulator n=1 Tax=Natronomicrosphaera hydrolytica TaxID=3242702 RepID=A0ABV4U4K5_9BACT